MKKRIGILLLAFGIILLSGCSAPSADQKPAEPSNQQEEVTAANKEPDASPAEEKILVYLSGPEAMINKLESTFEETNGDVCDLLIMSCGQLRSKVWAEKEAGQVQADVVWGSDPLIFNKLDDAKLLLPLQLKDADAIRNEYRVADRNYIYVNERYITVIYNQDTLNSEPPTSFADLADPEYKGSLVMADGSQSATAFAIASSLYQLTGDCPDYFSALKKNEIMLSKSNGQVPSKIMEGQFALGIGPHDSVVRLTNKGKKEGFEVPLRIAWPSEGAIALQRPIAIVKRTDQSKEQTIVAQKFVNFMLSKKAQIITTKFGFVSVREDIENTFLPEGVEVYHVNWKKAAENEEILKSEYQKAFH